MELSILFIRSIFLEISYFKKTVILNQEIFFLTNNFLNLRKQFS